MCALPEFRVKCVAAGFQVADGNGTSATGATVSAAGASASASASATGGTGRELAVTSGVMVSLAMAISVGGVMRTLWA